MKARNVGMESITTTATTSRFRTQIQLACAIAICLLSMGARAGGSQTGSWGSNAVDKFYGAFTDTVTIDMPQHVGITPALSLTYSSSAGNGLAGVGWKLTGFPTIDRTGPTFDGADGDDLPGDRFRFRGERLLQCTDDSNSASCLTGGTHTTEHESHLRFQYDALEDKWRVWDTDGTLHIYTSVIKRTDSQTFRWGRTQIRDTLGHTIDFVWSCDYPFRTSSSKEFDCVPKSVTYGSFYVHLYYEIRPDVLVYATGAELLHLDLRLTGVAIRRTDFHWKIRAYRFGYIQSQATERSLLTRVIRYGSDHTIGGDGPSGSSAVPPTVYKYADSQLPRWNPDTGYAPPIAFRDTEMLGMNTGHMLVDIDGDARPEILQSNHNFTDSVDYALYEVSDGSWTQSGYPVSHGGDRLPPFMMRTFCGDSPVDMGVRPADLNGDGRADFIMSYYDYDYTNAACAQVSDGLGGTRSFSKAEILRGRGITPSQLANNRLHVAAAWIATENGYVRDDSYAPPFDAANQAGVFSSYFANSWDTGLRVVNLNGDAYPDLLQVYRGEIDGSPSATIQRAWLNNPNATASEQRWLPADTYAQGLPYFVDGEIQGYGAGVQLGDVNGDGLTDVLQSYDGLRWGEDPPEEKRTGAWLNTGRGFVPYPDFEPPTPFLDSWVLGWDTGARLLDVNGDGLLDVMATRNMHNRYLDWLFLEPKKKVWLNNGTTFVGLGTGTEEAAAMLGNIPYMIDHRVAGHDTGTRTADVNGDGVVDFVQGHRSPGETPDDGQTANAWVSSHGKVDLMTGINNGIGGEVTITYSPSVSWPQTRFPYITFVVTRVEYSDGRISPSRTDYTYSGGRYDGEQKRFLGFQRVMEEGPCGSSESACPYTETIFRQRPGEVSLPENVRHYSSDGTLMHESFDEYVMDESMKPHQLLSHIHAERRYGTDEDGVRTVLKIGRVAEFDSYGNVILEYLTEREPTGDKETKLVEHDYFANAEAYIVSLPAARRTYTGGPPEERVKLAEQRFYYDGATIWEQAPELGQRTRVETWLDTDDIYVATTLKYDERGYIESVTDATGATTDYEVNSYGHITKTTLPPNEQGERQVLMAGRDLICEKTAYRWDPNGLRTDYHYDELCRLERIDFPTGHYQKWQFDVSDDSFVTVTMCEPAATGDGEACTATIYDGMGRPWRVQTAAPGESTIFRDTAYNGRGLPSTFSGPYDPAVDAVREVLDSAGRTTLEAVLQTSLEYDDMGRVTMVEHPDGSSITKSYNLLETTTRSEVGDAIIEVTDAAGRVVERREMLQDETTQWFSTYFAYDELGRLVQIQDAQGNSWAFEWDSLGRQTLVSDPDMGTWQQTYDIAGRARHQRDAKQQLTTYRYDALGRMTERTTKSADGVTAETVRWQYDEARGRPYNLGRLTSMHDVNGKAFFNYDKGGNVIYETRTIDDVAYVFERGFDAAGRRLWTRYPDGDSVGSASNPVEYDGHGRVRRIPGVVDDVEYTKDDRISRIATANGAVSTRLYSPERRWLTSKQTTLHGTVQQDLEYIRRSDGRIERIRSGFGERDWTFQYDTMQRLIRADNEQGTWEYSYGPTGNMLTAQTPWGEHNYSYPLPGEPRPHAANAVDSSSYAYDDNGNLTTGGGRDITWSVDNRPLRINDESYAYAGDGQRIKKTATQGTTLYFSDSGSLTGCAFTKYISVGGELVAKRVGLDSMHWYHSDHLGTVQGVNADNAVATARRAYAPYGEITFSGTEDALGYTGQRTDASGLVYLQARYYDPVLRRFISPDPTIPVLKAVGLNRYAYAVNDPISFSDITGLGPYSEEQQMQQWEWDNGSNATVTRVFGFVRSVFGLVYMVGGIAAGWTGVGVAGVLFGLDEFVAGIRMTATGKPARSALQALIEEASRNYISDDRTARLTASGIHTAIALLVGGGIGGAGGLGDVSISVPKVVGDMLALGETVVIGGSTIGAVAGAGAGLTAHMAANGGGNSAQWKKLSNGEIRKLKQAGYDPHALKGGKNASKYDLYKDANGNIYVKPKNGTGPGDWTGVNIHDL